VRAARKLCRRAGAEQLPAGGRHQFAKDGACGRGGEEVGARPGADPPARAAVVAQLGMEERQVHKIGEPEHAAEGPLREGGGKGGRGGGVRIGHGAVFDF